MRMTRAVSVVEVIVAVVILGLVAMLAIPRFGQAATSSSDPGENLRYDLRVLRLAIERYHQDHGVFPAQQGDGTHAAGTPEAFVAQLTRFTDASGHAAPVADATHNLGPYLRDGIPRCPVPPHSGMVGVCIVHEDHPQPAVQVSEPAGWLYNPETGSIAPNSEAADADGHPYASF